MELLPRIEIYSAIPYSGGDDSTIDDWFHVARNEPGEHIEAIWDIETLFRPEVEQENKVTALMGLESQFSEIRLHYTLNYVAWRYHEDLMIWAIKALKPGGKISIVAPDFDSILTYCIADALNAEISSIIANEDEFVTIKQQNEDLRSENNELREALNLSSSSSWYNIKRKKTIEVLLQNAEIPRNQFNQLEREKIIEAVPDKINKDIKNEGEFDLWLMQQLYSSGAGEPPDVFKAIFGKRYLSILLRKTQFITTLLQNNPQNPMQIEAKAFKHQSRLLTRENIKIL